MVYLLLAILSSATIAFIFKISETKLMNRYVVTSANYLMASLISLLMIFRSDLNWSFSSKWALGVGIPAGLFFFLSFIFYQKSVKENGVGLAGTFAKMGILVPMLLSLLIWQEYPEFLQWVGILIALGSILIVNFPFKKDLRSALHLNLILLFLTGGIAEFSNKLFQKYAILDYKNLFLFAVFFTALLISLVYTIKAGKRVRLKEVLTGLLVGIPNLFSSYFLIMALNELKTAVVFPIFSAGTIMVLLLVGFLVFKESLKQKELIAILMTIIALVLINL